MDEKKIRDNLAKKIKEFNLPEDPQKIKLSGVLREVTYNDGVKEVVDELAEFYLAKKYFLYFIDKYGFHLDAKNKQISPFKTFKFQRELIIPAILNHKYVIFRKCRQMGISVLTGLYSIWMANFNVAQNIIIISKSKDDAKEYKEKAMVTYERLPVWLKTKPIKGGDNKLQLKLLNNSSITVKAQSKTAGRSASPSLVILDEAAFMPWADTIWSAVYPSLTVTQGQCFVISTSNGVGNLYHRLWVKAKSGENEFHPVFVPWWMFPGRDDELRSIIENKRKDIMEKELPENVLKEIKNNNERNYFKSLAEAFITLREEKAIEYKGPKEKKPWLKKQLEMSTSRRDFNSEILAKFLGSGETVIDPERIEVLSTKTKEPIFIGEIFSEKIEKLRIFELPKYNIEYTIVVDVATGSGNDNNAFHIFRDDTREQVADYKNIISTIKFAKIIRKIAKIYNNAFIIIETNKGLTVFNEIFLNDKEPYKNVYAVKKGKAWRGLETTSLNRKLMVDEFVEDIENEYVKVYSEVTWDEIKVFVWKNGKAQAESGYNDDLVLSLMFYCYALKYLDRYRNKTNSFIGLINNDIRYVEKNNDEVEQLEDLIHADSLEYKTKTVVEDSYGLDWETYKSLIT